jgi:hypothetical protein
VCLVCPSWGGMRVYGVRYVVARGWLDDGREVIFTHPPVKLKTCVRCPDSVHMYDSRTNHISNT